jgi:hypothetical protein
VFMAKSTSFWCVSHSLWSVFIQAAIANTSVRLTRSTKPEMCGCSPVAKTVSDVPSFHCVSCKLGGESCTFVWNDASQTIVCEHHIIREEFDQFLGCCVWNGGYLYILR